MYHDFLERIRDLATGLGAPVSQGGLSIRAEDKEMVGIMGENSSVSLFLFCEEVRLIRSPGVHHPGARLYPVGHALCSNFMLFHSF